MATEPAPSLLPPSFAPSLAPRLTPMLAPLLVVLACRPDTPTSAPAAEERPSLDQAIAMIDEEDLARHVQVLASDAFGGRFPGTAGEAKTLSYISAQLAAAGIEPAVSGGFTQEVPLQRSLVDPSARITLTGPGGSPLVLAWGDDFLAGSGRGEAQVTIGDAQVVFAGYGIVAPEYAWDDYAGIDVKGKLVVVLGGEPSSDDNTLFEGRALTHHGTRTGKMKTAAALGAAALLTLRADGENGIAWSTLANGAKAPKYAIAAGKDEVAAQAHGILLESSAKRALALAGADLDELRSAAEERGFRARALDLRASIDLATEIRPELSHNIVGLLRGRKRPDEYVVYTAHWDHVGIREHLEGDSIFNGAVDNATGISALLELAQAYGSLDSAPERSVVFIATTAEEQGLLGSFYYTAHPVFPLERTMGVVNIDALFPFGAFEGMTVVAQGSSDMDAYLDRAAHAVGRTTHPDPAPEHGAFFRSDHYPFALKGVPALFAVGGPSPDTPMDEQVIARFQDYMVNRYHQPADEYDASTWDMAGIRQDVEIFFRLGVDLANSTDVPNWRADHAFRAKRDAMLAL